MLSRSGREDRGPGWRAAGGQKDHTLWAMSGLQMRPSDPSSIYPVLLWIPGP